MNDRERKIEKLSREVWKQLRNTLLLKYRYFDKALFSLSPIPLDVEELMTDGKGIYYNKEALLKKYHRQIDELYRDYLHIILHCIYYHPFPREGIDSLRWNTACDITVEAILYEMTKRENYRGLRSFKQEPFIEEFREKLGVLTAEKLYYHLDEYKEEEVDIIGKIFKRDLHSFWYPKEYKDLPDEDKYESYEDYKREDSEELLNQWERISEQTKVKIQALEESDNQSLNMMIQNLEQVNQETYDYRSFLEKFAVSGEDIKINEDEFDYIYYAYGLELYGNMPLINPLEYKEVSKIREFVIAIDTSGSVKGELVQAFMEKTYNILSQYENFYSKVNIHIIQCDTEIRRVDIIKSPREFEDYLKDFSMEGFGGTDFRPVFDYVDEKILEGEFFNLKGMLYFTDGHGKYPQGRPDYNCAFVFLDEFPIGYEPPIWAMTLVLKRYDLGESYEYKRSKKTN